MTTLAQISETQAQKATTANENFDAVSPAGLFGRRAAGVTGLTWAYFGGIIYVDGVATSIADGTVALTAGSTNYVEATRAGVVSANTTGFTAGRIPLYTVVTGASTISSYADKRATGEQFTHSRLAKSVAGGAGTTVLTRDEAAVEILELTGALTGNRTLEVPAVAWPWIVYNNTSGAFTLTVKTNAGTGIEVPQGKRTLLYCDGTNVVDTLDSLSNLYVPGQLIVGGTSTAVSFGATTHRFQVTNLAGGSNVLAPFAYFGNDASGAVFMLAKSRSATVGGYTYPTSADTLGGIFFSGANEALSRFSFGAEIRAVAGSTLTSSNFHTDIQIHVTGSGSASRAEQVRILGVAGATRYVTLAGSNGGAPTLGTSAGDLAVSAAMHITGANAAHGASRLGLGQDSTSVSRIIAYGADATTAGILRFDCLESDGGGGEVGRFTAQRYFKASSSGTYQGATAAYHELLQGSTTATDATLAVSHVATSGDNLFITFATEAAGGSIRGSIDYNRGGAAVRYNTTSDARLKVDRGIAAEPLYLKALTIHDFDWAETGHRSRGVFAQEAYEVFPDAISVGDDMRPWGADYSKYVPDLIVGWQSHERELAAHRAWRAKAEAALAQAGITIH